MFLNIDHSYMETYLYILNIRNLNRSIELCLDKLCAALILDSTEKQIRWIFDNLGIFFFSYP